MRVRTSIPMIALGAMLALGCNDDVSAPGDVTQVIRFLVVTPGYDTLTAIADTGRLVALAFDSLNVPIANPSVGWATSDATVATVDQGGLVRAERNGVVLVTASGAGQSAFATVVVRQEIAAARIAPDNVALTGAGDTVRLSAVAVDRNGFVVDGAAFTWRSSNAFFASVDTTGLVTARVDGTAAIVATENASGRSDTATVSVTGAPRPPELIAFVSGCSWVDDSPCILEVMGVDGSGRSVVVGNARFPAWSRDGARLAYTSLNTLGIEYIEFGGSQERRIVTDNFPRYVDLEPAWSPDGTTLAFVRVGYADSLGHTGGYKIWLVNADGSNPRQLDERSGGDTEHHPTWSPDGTKIAFARWWPENNGWFTLVVNSDGSGPIDSLFPGGFPSWSPDGSQLAFSDMSSSIVLMNPDGSGRTVLTQGYGPAWSPDGTQIVFTVHSGVGGLYVINRDGTGRRGLVTYDTSSPDIVPVWDPAWGLVLPAQSASGSAATPTRLRSRQ